MRIPGRPSVVGRLFHSLGNVAGQAGLAQIAQLLPEQFHLSPQGQQIPLLVSQSLVEPADGIGLERQFRLEIGDALLCRRVGHAVPP